MLIALDFDGTYTEHPELWDGFISAARTAGHTVICCTMRHEETEGADVWSALRGKVDRIVFTGRIAKAEALRACGIRPNVWIDDAPHWIFQDAL